ncbi:MAG: PIG-L family deacetylase [Muribaculaceae bacterium]|nr:PIG-L family deacetylase [Muribaculaceae bacterium]
MNRREMLKMSGLAAAGATILGLPMSADAAPVGAANRKKVLVIGAHPDDPETTTGGTICLLTDAGHDVVCVYLTRGQAGIEGKSHSEAAAIRSAEAEAACEVMGARAVFMSQIDGNTEANLDRYREMRELIDRENPDIVITHWPIDGHRDHAICGILVLDAWRRLDRRFKLFYFEAMSGTQTQMFSPSHWVDISATVERKHEACYCHESQDIRSFYDGWHGTMERFRGMEARCQVAEAFRQHIDALPTLS